MKSRRLPLGGTSKRQGTATEQKAARPAPPSKRTLPTRRTTRSNSMTVETPIAIASPLSHGNGDDSREELSGSVEPSHDLKDADTDEEKTSADTTAHLSIVNKDGKRIIVRILLGNTQFDPTTFDSNSAVGYDGNQYFCQVCREFGNVVCCDGCPRVYHQACIPEENPSRLSLERDEDPWYCPHCMEHGKTVKDRKTVIPMCIDCGEKRRDLSLEPCVDCGSFVHHPHCMEEDSGEIALCSECRVTQQMSQEDDPRKEDIQLETDEQLEDMDEEEEEEGIEEEEEKSREESDDEDGKESRSARGDDPDDEDEGGEEFEPKRKRRKSSSSLTPSKKKQKGSKEKKLIKKKKIKQKRAESIDNTSYQSPEPVANTYQHKPVNGTVKATPAFYFYLGENRWKIERVLARKHRFFNRLPKGVERNELVAREAAAWWVKLRPADHRRYMNMSMRDYEARIVEWKEEKALHGIYEPELVEGEVTPVEEDTLSVSDDAQLTFDKYERLYMSTSVGSKPFKPESDQSYNRVLLDLLHDMRFHPLPMICVHRPETETVIDELSAKVTIPHFEVHGPIATSVGDECLGCSRGWTHYCHVLKRRMPAIEHRAKLQPPLSSLIATRIGLGMRPRLEKEIEPDEIERIKPDLFRWRDSEEQRDLRNLPVVPSCTLTEPGERLDDIAQFIEETTVMKVPEPSRPQNPKITGNKKIPRTLPIHRKKKDSDDGKDDGQLMKYNKCGRCRTIIETETGCVQCRRAQLVINMSKRQPASGQNRTHKEQKFFKVQTAMLGRVHLKEGGGETLNLGDTAVANAILKERWTPCTIVPPRTADVPRARENESLASEHVIEDKEDDVEMEVDEENMVTDDVKHKVLDFSTNEDHEGQQNQLRKRARSTRSTASSSAGNDRQAIAQKNKKKVDEFHKKAVATACYGVFLAMVRRDPLLLFAKPVTAENYTEIVKKPVDFSKMRSNLLDGKYGSVGALISDAKLLCDNALAYNPPASIYSKTAKELRDCLAVMQRRALNWIGAIKNTYASFLARQESEPRRGSPGRDEDSSEILSENGDDPFEDLRRKWPAAAEMLENSERLRSQVEADFMRTAENETAYYGTLAVRRAAAAAEASLAPYTDSRGLHSVVSMRNHLDDEELRAHVDERVQQMPDFVQLKDISSWREESVVRLMRKVQTRRLERRTISENGCSRCDGILMDPEVKRALNAEQQNPNKPKKKHETDEPRVDPSRVSLSTGLGSAKTRKKVDEREKSDEETKQRSVNGACVSVRGSKIHGMGLFADQPFNPGDIVAEYVGEYVTNPTADAREKVYREQHIQDYQFSLDHLFVIDATMKGGHARYINHNCSPNCVAKIIPGDEPNTFLRRVMIIAQQKIQINDEITYDYQFPLELNLCARIPCNCQSDACRGFMNWDLPEKGSNNRALLVQKRGANMRDRIRRLGRPLKRDDA